MPRINPQKQTSNNSTAFTFVYASSLGTKGNDGKVRGTFPFVPLFTTSELENLINNNLENAGHLNKYTYGVYRFITKNEEGKAKWNNIELIDSSMRIADGLTYNDVTIDLGLDLPAEQRVSIPVMCDLNYQTKADFSSYGTRYFLPVIWEPDTSFNRSRFVADDSGKITFLVLDKPSQIKNLLEAMQEEEPEVLEWRDGKSINEEYDYEGYGRCIVYNKDTSKAYDSHKFSRSVPVRECHYISSRQKASELWTEANEHLLKYSGGYLLMNLDEKFDSGEITGEEYDATVYAWSAKRFLNGIGHEVSDTTSDLEVIEMFQQLLPKYNLSLETQIGNAIVDEVVIKPNRPSVDVDENDVPF